MQQKKSRTLYTKMLAVTFLIWLLIYQCKILQARGAAPS